MGSPHQFYSLKLLYCAGCLALTSAAALGQRAVVDFRNSGSFTTAADRLVYFDQTGGLRVTGTNYLAQLYFGTDSASLAPLAAAPAPFRTPDPTFAGTWVGGFRTLSGAVPGGTNFFQVKAWDSDAGSSFESALANGGWVAQSAVFSEPTPVSGTITLEHLRAFSGLVAPCLLSISDTIAIPGLNGAATALFPVTLTPASTQSVSVAYATVDGTAKSGVDYQATNGVVTFNPGGTNGTVRVTITAPPTATADKFFFVRLASPVGRAIVWDGQGQGTVTRLRITSLLRSPGQAARITFITAAGQNYNLEKSAALGTSWLPVSGATNLAGTGSAVTATDSEPASQPQQYFRVRLVP